MPKTKTQTAHQRFVKWLQRLGACRDGIAYVEHNKFSARQFWLKSNKGGYMLWLACHSRTDVGSIANFRKVLERYLVKFTEEFVKFEYGEFSEYEESWPAYVRGRLAHTRGKLDVYLASNKKKDGVYYLMPDTRIGAEKKVANFLRKNLKVPVPYRAKNKTSTGKRKARAPVS